MPKPILNESDALRELRSELSVLSAQNQKLRKILADSNLPCTYCGKPVEDMENCRLAAVCCKRQLDRRL